MSPDPRVPAPTAALPEPNDPAAVLLFARCLDCPRTRPVPTATSMMAGHADDTGEFCSGSVKMPDAVLTGTERDQALADYAANQRGEFCARGQADSRHDVSRCPGYHV